MCMPVFVASVPGFNGCEPGIPTTLPPSENESFLSRHDDVRADRNAEYIVDQIGEMEFHVDEEHRNAA